MGVQKPEGGGRSGRGVRSGRVASATQKRAAATMCDVNGGGDKRKKTWRHWEPK